MARVWCWSTWGSKGPWEQEGRGGCGRWRLLVSVSVFVFVGDNLLFCLLGGGKRYAVWMCWGGCVLIGFTDVFGLESVLGIGCGFGVFVAWNRRSFFHLSIAGSVSRFSLSRSLSSILTGFVIHCAGTFNCSLGFWVPKNSSRLPTYDRCKADIFGQMIEGCQGDATVNVANANLKRLPRRTETERDTGEAFDPLYPSEFVRILALSETHADGAWCLQVILSWHRTALRMPLPDRRRSKRGVMNKG